MPIIPQRRFVKGINAATPGIDQPSGSLPAASNFLYTRRGGLHTTPGSAAFSYLDAGIELGPRVLDILNYRLGPSVNNHVAVVYDPLTHIGAIADLAAADAGAGGALPAGDVFWYIASLDGIGHQTLPSNAGHVNFALAGEKADLTWTPKTAAALYAIYREVPPAPAGLIALIQAIGVSTFTDDGTIAPGAAPVGLDSTAISRFMRVPPGVYSRALAPAGDTLYLLPAAPHPVGGPTYAVGNISNLPELVQFDDKVIIALGSTHPILVYDGGAGTVAPVTNTFVPAYPAWAANQPFAAGALIQQLVGAVNVVFEVQQGGVSAAAPPAWPADLGQTVADGTIIWVYKQSVPSTDPPKGAAHAIVYAGALWVANTYPATLKDALGHTLQDGPCALRMSDLNNPDSWNPLNVAFIGKDDGTEITGLATFTIAESGISPTGSLVVFKNFQTYQIIGVFGSSNFAIQQAQTEMGCIAPRTIRFLPGFGICRLTHLGVAIFDGVRDRLISPEVYPYLFPIDSSTTPVDMNYLYFSKAAVSIKPPMYVLAIPAGATGTTDGGLTRLLCYDLVLKAWAVIDLPIPISILRDCYISFSPDVAHVMAGDFITARVSEMLDPANSQWQTDTPVIGTYVPVLWSVQTPEVYSRSDAEKLYTRALYIRGSAAGIIPATINVQLVLDSGPANEPTEAAKVVSINLRDFEAHHPLHRLGKTAHAVISGSGQIELDSFNWDVEPQPAAPGVLV